MAINCVPYLEAIIYDQSGETYDQPKNHEKSRSHDAGDGNRASSHEHYVETKHFPIRRFFVRVVVVALTKSNHDCHKSKPHLRPIHIYSTPAVKMHRLLSFDSIHHQILDITSQISVLYRSSRNTQNNSPGRRFEDEESEDRNLVKNSPGSVRSTYRTDTRDFLNHRSRILGDLNLALDSVGTTHVTVSYSPPVSDDASRPGISRDWTILFQAHRESFRKTSYGSSSTTSILKQCVTGRRAQFASIQRNLLSALKDTDRTKKRVVDAVGRVQTAALRAEASLAPLVRNRQRRIQQASANLIDCKTGDQIRD